MDNKEPWVDNLDEAIRKNEEQGDKSEQAYKSLKQKTWKKVGFVGVLVTAVCLFAIIYSNLSAGIPKDKQSEYQGTTVSISTYTDYLQYQPKNISTNLGDWTAEFNLDISDCIVTAFDNYDTHTYIAYMSEDQNLFTEIIVSKTIPDELNLDEKTKNDLSKTNETIIEITDSADMSIEKAYRNLYDTGYLIVLQQAKVESEKQTFANDMLNTIYDCMLYSKNNSDTQDNKKLYIEIDGLATLDLNQLSVLNGNAGIYFGQDNVLRLYNFANDTVYGYITNINNQYMMNKPDNLERVDGWNNLYNDKDKDNIDMMGYRGFGVQTPKGFYYIKVDEKAPEGLEDEIIEWLGIKADDLKLDTAFGE